MLTVEGTKMSKTRGTFINARDYLRAGLDPEWLRYFYAANLGPTPSDIDLSLGELKNRVNGELLNNVGNLANRALSLIWKNGGRLTTCAAIGRVRESRATSASCTADAIPGEWCRRFWISRRARTSTCKQRSHGNCCARIASSRLPS